MTAPVVVVGGGIVGVSIALNLADRGAQVVLVERDATPQGASASSFASITAMDEPSSELYLLKSMGMVAWRTWTDRLGDVGFRLGGEIRWAETRQAAEDLTVVVERARSRGYPVRVISEDELRAHLPQAMPGTVLAASLAPNDGQVDPKKAILAARAAIERFGGRLVSGRASLIVGEDEIEVRVGQERIKASTVVVSAGAETGPLAEMLGWEIPMVPSPGFLVHTTPIDRVTDATVYVSPETGAPIHLRQADDGRVVVGERTQDFVSKKPGERHAMELLRAARRFFPDLADALVEHFTLEWRPMPADKLPIIGRAPGLPALYFATMHSGVTLAPAVGNLISEEIAEQTSNARLESFRPTRFADRNTDLIHEVEQVFRSQPEIFLG